MRKFRFFPLILLLIVISVFSLSVFSVSADTVTDDSDISYDNLFSDNYLIKVGYTSVLPQTATRYFSLDVIDPNLSIYFIKLSSTVPVSSSVSWDGIGTFSVAIYESYSLYSLFVRDGFFDIEGTSPYFFSFNIYNDVYAVCSFNDLFSNYTVYGNPSYDYFNVSNRLYVPDGLEVYVLPNISLENYFSSYALGVNAGKIIGRIEGISIGLELGYSDGYGVGYDNGYSEGYTRGNNDLTNYLEDNNIADYTSSPLLLVSNTFQTLFNTQILGAITVADICYIVFGFMLLLFVLKRVT